jgi:hypothetical protein
LNGAFRHAAQRQYHCGSFFGAAFGRGAPECCAV